MFLEPTLFEVSVGEWVFVAQVFVSGGDPPFPHQFTITLEAEGVIGFGFILRDDTFVVVLTSSELAHPSFLYSYPAFEVRSLLLTGPPRPDSDFLACPSYTGVRPVFFEQDQFTS
jgi:hypothetical protein